MTISSNFRRVAFLTCCAMVGFAGLARAQWQPVREAGHFDGVLTTNGVTEVQYSWVVGGFNALTSLGPLLRDGNHFSFNFDFEQNEGAGGGWVMIQQTNVVLGALAPGRYTLTTTSWNVPIYTNTFTIAAPQFPKIGSAKNVQLKSEASTR